MTFTTAQSDWVTALAGACSKKEQFDKVEERRNLLVAQATMKLKTRVGQGSVKERVRGGFEGEVLVGQKRLPLLKEEGTQMDEWEIEDGGEISDERRDELMRAMTQVDIVAGDMRNTRQRVVSGKVEVRTFTEEEILKKADVGWEPVFSEEDLNQELYQPLVRERVISENQVPDMYSATQRMIDASNKLYKDRLNEYTKENVEEEDWTGLAKMTIQTAGTIAKETAKLFGDAGEMAVTVTELVEKGLTAGITLYSALSKQDVSGFIDGMTEELCSVLADSLEAGGLDKASEVTKLVGLVATGLKGSSTSIVQGIMASPRDWGSIVEGIQTAVSTSLEGAVSGIKGEDDRAEKTREILGEVQKRFDQAMSNGQQIARLKAAIETGDINGAIDVLGAVSKSAFGELGDKLGALAKPESEDQDTPSLFAQVSEESVDQVGEIGKQVLALRKVSARKRALQRESENLVLGVSGALRKALTGKAEKGTVEILCVSFESYVSAKEISDALLESEPAVGKALSHLGRMLSKAILTVNADDLAIKGAAAQVEQEFNRFDKMLELAELFKSGEPAEATRRIGAGSETILGTQLSAQGVPEALKGPSVQDNVRRDLQKDQLAKAKERLDGEAQEQSKHPVEDLDGASIEVLLKNYKRDRQLLELAATVAKGGMAVAEKFFAPMAAGGAAIRFVENVVKAALRATQLYKWARSKTDTQIAQSEYSTSVKNFVKNQSEQLSHYTIRAALELTEMIGDILASTGVASAAGVAIQATTVMAKASQDLIEKVYDKVELERAWKYTRRSLANPRNRKLALKVRAMNPTLAKYTIAWGAVVAKDPLARDCLKACNISEINLAHKDSGVDVLQKYLEAYYSDDRTVLKKVDQGDYLPEPELSLKCWITGLARAEKEGKLIRPDTPEINANLRLLAEGKTALDLAFSLDAANKCLKAAQALETELYKVKLVYKDQLPHETARGFADALSVLARKESIAMAERIQLGR